MNPVSSPIYVILNMLVGTKSSTENYNSVLSTVWATFTVLRRYPFLRLDLCLNGTDIIRRRTPFVFVGNNVYQMDVLNIGSRLQLDAGTLSLYTTQPVGLASSS